MEKKRGIFVVKRLHFLCDMLKAEMSTGLDLDWSGSGPGAELGGATAPQILPGPPKNFSRLFLKVLHRPLTAPLVAKLAPPVAPQMKMSGSAPDSDYSKFCLIWIGTGLQISLKLRIRTGFGLSWWKRNVAFLLLKGCIFQFFCTSFGLGL